MRMCLVVVCLLLQSTLAFNFKELVVTPTLHTINVVTTYSIAYDRTVDNNLVTTSYASNAVQSTATITVTFSLQYTLSSSISCQVKVNNAGNYVVNPCLVSGNVVTLSNVFSVATIVTAVSLILTNVVNPSPAITTGEFGGTIGSDVAVSNDLNSIVTLTPAAFLSQSFTFSPNYVYRTESMIFTIKANNQIGASGTITLQFPFNRKWTNELSSTRLIPISASMPCTSISSVMIIAYLERAVGDPMFRGCQHHAGHSQQPVH